MSPSVFDRAWSELLAEGIHTHCAVSRRLGDSPGDDCPPESPARPSFALSEGIASCCGFARSRRTGFTRLWLGVLDREDAPQLKITLAAYILVLEKT